MFDHEGLEMRIRAHHDSGDYAAAATLILQQYGPAVLSFLVGKAQSQTLAAETFSLFSEQLWRGLPRVRWRSSVRVWVFTLAKNALARHLGARHRWSRRHVPWSDQPGSEPAPRARTVTQPFSKTSVRDHVARLRDTLGPDDQLLLLMRVDQGLPWQEIARLLLERRASVDELSLCREAARLRKRFQLLKARLRQLAASPQPAE